MINSVTLEYKRMIIEINTKLLDIPEKINLNQLLFLSMVLDKNQKANNQDVRRIVSLIDDDEISCLVQQGLLTSIERGESITYKETDKLLNYIKPSKAYFDLFFEMYPVYVDRPDGTKGYLRTNIHKCRHLYNTYVGNSQTMAEHINKCLEKELAKKAQQGKLGYMKTMWRWLVDHQWEEIEEEMRHEETTQTQSYGTELI